MVYNPIYKCLSCACLASVCRLKLCQLEVGGLWTFPAPRGHEHFDHGHSKVLLEKNNLQVGHSGLQEHEGVLDALELQLVTAYSR
jgi:hypothetical protein